MSGKETYPVDVNAWKSVLCVRCRYDEYDGHVTIEIVGVDCVYASLDKGGVVGRVHYL